MHIGKTASKTASSDHGLAVRTIEDNERRNPFQRVRDGRPPRSTHLAPPATTTQNGEQLKGSDGGAAGESVDNAYFDL